MLAEALRIAGEYGGTIVGDCAIAHLVPGFPIKTYTIEAPRDRIDHVKSMHGGKIRVAPYRSSGMSPLVIEECYYEPSGVFRASPDALAAAETRTMRPVAPVRLDRVYTFRRHGFKITGVTLSDHCVYMPELHEQLMDTSEITVIEFEDMHVTDDLISDLNRPDRAYVFRRCTVVARNAPVEYAEDTIFFGTDISHVSCVLVRCSGCVTVHDHMFVRMTNCPDLCVESIISDNTTDPYKYGDAFVVEYTSDRVIVAGLICRYEAKERNVLNMKFLVGLPTLSCAQIRSVNFDECSTMPEHWQLCAKDESYLFRYMQEKDPFSPTTIAALESAPIGVRIPLDMLSRIDWLVQFTEYGMTYVRYPYYTNFLLIDQGQLLSAMARMTICPRTLCSDIPSFIINLSPLIMKLFAGAVFRPTRSVNHPGSAIIVTALDIDGILDMIDRDNVTSDDIDFLSKQLDIDWMHDGALERALSRHSDQSRELIKTAISRW